MPKKYFGKQTEQALQNFPFDISVVSLELIYAIADVKQAAAIANNKSEILSKYISSAIVTVCKEIKKGKFDDQFVTSSLQGGAGTSINMNVNEVIASRATEILGKNVHPNDHVNMSQSTNDVNPTALRLVSIQLIKQLIVETSKLITAFNRKSKKYINVNKLARTHMQDAVMMTAGQEIAAWSATIERDLLRLNTFSPFLHDTHLGGTAIGNKINTPPKFIATVLQELRLITKIPFKQAKNLFSFTSTTSDFANLSNIVTLLAGDLSKIAHDIRFLASGPRGSIGEYKLKPLQPGSSIMPGKVNPVIPEMMNQIYYHVSGKNLAVQMANETSDLQLAVMFPTVADSLINSLKLLITGIKQFRTSCIDVLEVDEKRCRENLEKSTAYATLLTPILGYDIVSNCVKEAVKTDKTIKEVILSRGLLSADKLP